MKSVRRLGDSLCLADYFSRLAGVTLARGRFFWPSDDDADSWVSVTPSHLATIACILFDIAIDFQRERLDG